MLTSKGTTRGAQRKLPILAPLLLAATRLGTTLFRDLPLLAITTRRGQTREALDVRCSLWYTSGVLRSLLPIVTGLTRYSAFLRSMNFRSRNGERAAK